LHGDIKMSEYKNKDDNPPPYEEVGEKVEEDVLEGVATGLVYIIELVIALFETFFLFFYELISHAFLLLLLFCLGNGLIILRLVVLDGAWVVEEILKGVQIFIDAFLIPIDAICSWSIDISIPSPGDIF